MPMMLTDFAQSPNPSRMGGDQSSTWQLFPDLDRTVWTQTVGIRERGRVSLPVAVRDRLSWVSSAGIFLSMLNGDGSVEIFEWERRGNTVLAAVKERYDALPPSQRADFALAAMDRFMRVTGEKGGRLTLPTVLRTQLDPFRKAFLRVVVRDDRLQLWDDELWKAQRTARIARLEKAGII